jgi:CHAD domain-containing protein
MAKAWNVPGLHRDATFRDAAGRVVLTRWREMMGYRDGTLAGEDIEELHAMRVSSRRLRAAMDAFAGAFPTRSFRRNLRVVKEITDTLGAARDLDVAVDGLEAVMADFTAEERLGITSLVAEYRERRVEEAAHIAALFARLDDERFGRRFERWVGRHTGVDPKRLRTGPGDGE